MKLSNIVRRLRTASACVLTPQQRRKVWPAAPPLDARHVQNCKMFEHRDVMLKYLPKQGVCAEVGIDQAEFSEKILRTSLPAKLHLMDISAAAIDNANHKFKKEISAGTIATHLGDSSMALLSFPEEYFDWIYIDGDHSYDGARRDLEASVRTLKRDGLIAVNDYIFFSPSDFEKYGVVEAVNEFCRKYDFEFVYFALQGRMYNDVVLSRIED